MRNYSLFKFSYIILALLTVTSAHAFEKCWYQHIGFRSGQPYISPLEGQVLGDFQSKYFGSGEIFAHWDDDWDMTYEIKAIVDETAGICQITATVFNRKSDAITRYNNVDPGAGCRNGFLLSMQTFYSDSIIQEQVKKRFNNEGPIFTGVQYGCQPH